MFQIIQTKTMEIFAHPEFLGCDVDSVSYIVKQDKLNCGELDVWKAVLSWAKSRAQSNEGPEIRKWILGPLQHIRLLTLTITDLHNEVFVWNVFKSDEMVGICKRDIKDIEALCKKSEKRGNTSSIIVQIKQNIKSGSGHYQDSNTSSSCIVVKETTINLLSVTCKGNIQICNSHKDYFFGHLMTVDITITITRITNHMDNTSDEEPVVIRHNDFKLFFAELFTIPTVVGDKGVILLANSKYKIDLLFRDTVGNSNLSTLPSWSDPDCVKGHTFEHGKFYCSLNYDNGIGETPCHIRQFTYSAAMD